MSRVTFVQKLRGRNPLLTSLRWLLCLCIFLGMVPTGMGELIGLKPPTPAAKAIVPPALPAKWKNLPKMTPGVAPMPKGAHKGVIPISRSYLNEVGLKLAKNIPPSELAAWTQTVADPKAKAADKAWGCIYLGEKTLAVDHQPVKAGELFVKAHSLSHKGQEQHGLASYDLAIADFYAGYYADSERQFLKLISHKEPGYEGANAAQFHRHARACAGYHKQRELAGITEPGRLDPLCGSAGIAVVLQKLNKPHDRKLVTSKVNYTGLGSNFDDLKLGALKLGLSPHPLVATDKTLKALFSVSDLPIIAHVEHDHFITLTAANDKGVSYVCSDCGSWPGGKRSVTWKQWRMMDSDAVMAFAVPGSAYDTALSRVQSPEETTAIKLSYMRAVQQGDVKLAALVERIASVLRNAGVTFLPFPPGSISCGNAPEALKCIPCVSCCPSHSPQRGSSGPSPMAGDPVNLATGEEEYAPQEDLTVYNPIGPSVHWERQYNSLANMDYGFGHGWTNAYAYTIGLFSTVSSGNSASKSLVTPIQKLISLTLTVPNHGQVVFNAAGGGVPFPSVGSTVYLSPSIGYPYLAAFTRDSSTGGHAAVFTKDRQIMVFWGLSVAPSSANLGTLYDAHSNYIWFSYGTGGLQAIYDKNNVALLTLAHSGSLITAASDRYGRSVYYHQGTYQLHNINTNITWYELDQVSVVVPTGMSNPALRYQYGYLYSSNLEYPEEVPYLGSISVPSPAGGGQFSTCSFTYDPANAALQSITDPNGNKTVFTAAGPSKTTVSVYDPQNNLAEKHSVTFDSNMNVVSKFDALDRAVISYSYASPNTPFRPSSATDSANRTTQFTWDSYNNLLTSTSPKSSVATVTYTFANWFSGDIVSAKLGAKTSTTFTHAGNGDILTVSTPIPGETGTGNRQTTTYTYDTLGNITSVTGPGNNAGATWTVSANYTTDGSYSQPAAMGQPVAITDANGKVEHARYDSQGNLVSVTDQIGNTSNYGYDIANYLTTSQYPATGQTGSGRATDISSFGYPGGPLLAVNAYDESGSLSKSSSFAYGACAELMSRTGPGQSAAFVYTPTYRIKSLKDGNLNAVAYVYNTLGQLTSMAAPRNSGGTYDKVQLAYDVAGNLTQRTDGNGVVTNYLYTDADGMQSAISYPATPSQNQTLTYDSFDRPITVSDVTGSVTNAFDDLNEATSVTRTYTGLPARTVSYAYYPDGNRLSMAVAGNTWTYSYDANGRCTAISSPAGTSHSTYLDNGWQASRTLPNGVATQYTRNAVGSLVDLTNKTAQGAILTHYQGFQYDGVFNRIATSSTVPAATLLQGTAQYGYDAAARLTSESDTRGSGISNSYAYDGSGNPTTFRSVPGFSYNSDNQLTSGSFSYDGNGNPTTYAGQSLGFDSESRLSAVGSVSMGYRADGLRAWKQNGATRTYFYYDGGTPLFETDNSGAITALDIYAQDGLVARGTAGSFTYYSFDPQGNLSQRLDANQNAITSSAFDSFGQETVVGSFSDPYGYNAKNGYLKDTETNLYLCRHRYYDPSVGRWLTRDPLGNDGSFNLYGYCSSNPIDTSDPSGLMNSATTPQNLPLYMSCMQDIYDTGAAAVAQHGARVVATAAAVGAVSMMADTTAEDEKRDDGCNIPVYRVWGDDPYGGPNGSGPTGRYWALQDPRLSPTYAVDYGLPHENGGTNMTVGTWDGQGGTYRQAGPTVGAEGKSGGATEVFIPDFMNHVRVIAIVPLKYPIKTPFSRP